MHPEMTRNRDICRCGQILDGRLLKLNGYNLRSAPAAQEQVQQGCSNPFKLQCDLHLDREMMGDVSDFVN